MSIIQSQNSSNLQNLTYAQIQRLGNRNIPNINVPIHITRTGVRNFDNYNRQHLQAPVQNNINYTNIGQNSNQNISQNLNQNINQNSNQCQLPVSQVDYFRDILVTRSQPQVIAEEVNDCDGSVKIQRQKISVNYQATPWSIDPSFQVQPEYSTLVPRTIFNR